MTQILIIGGSDAGISAGLRARQLSPSPQVRLIVPGDCVETWHRILEKPTYLPLGTTAHKQGRIAGANVVDDLRSSQAPWAPRS